MIAEYHLAKQPVPLPYESVAVQMMLDEANPIAEKLKLPTPHPVQLTGIRYYHISPPWFNSMLQDKNSPFWPITVFSNHIYDTNIPREQRARAFLIGLGGTIETTNLLFAFDQGRLSAVERISENHLQYYSTDLDKLIGKTSLINDAEAHEMATQWLAAVDINVAALEKKYPPEVHHLLFTPKNSTNAVELPMYFVTWGWVGAPVSSEPLAEVKIFGTTKELVELSFPGLFRFSDASFSERPPLLITNAIDLVIMGNPPVKNLNVNTNQAKQIQNVPRNP